MLLHKISPHPEPTYGYQGGTHPSGVGHWDSGVWINSPRPALPPYPYQQAANNTGTNLERPITQVGTVPTGQLRITKYTSKNVYTAWLKRLSFDRGQYVIPRGALFPYVEGAYHRVVQMQEVHFLVSYNDVTGDPLAMEIVDKIGNRRWVYPLNYDIVIAPHNPEWQFDNVTP